MNGDAIIQRLAQRIGQLIAENEIIRQELIEVKEAQDGGNEQARLITVLPQWVGTDKSRKRADFNHGDS